MVECVDLLQSPECIVEGLLQRVVMAQEVGSSADRPDSKHIEVVSEEGVGMEAFFHSSRELFVQGDGCSFTCLATGVGFQEGESSAGGASSSLVRALNTIDFAPLTCESRPAPVLDFTQRVETESAYPILLRAFSGLIELIRPHRFDVLGRDVYRGLLGPAPAFDLALVLWDDDQPMDPRRPLCELTRDLAEVLKDALASEPRFLPVLIDIVCLRMNNKRFDGRLRIVWRL